MLEFPHARSKQSFFLSLTPNGEVTEVAVEKQKKEGGGGEEVCKTPEVNKGVLILGSPGYFYLFIYLFIL